MTARLFGNWHLSLTSNHHLDMRTEARDAGEDPDAPSPAFLTRFFQQVTALKERGNDV